jgi:hypothetical protein
MAWNDRQQGVHIWITPLTAPATATHLFYEARQGAWWMDQYANNNQNPLCCCTFDGNTASDRIVLTGGWDGYVRAQDPAATDDDGTAIESEVIIGPLTTKELDEMILKDLQTVIGETSGTVNFDILIGNTAEQALSATPIQSGTWTAGRNFTNSIMRAAHAIYLRITSSDSWAFESARLKVAESGRIRQRGKD